MPRRRCRLRFLNVLLTVVVVVLFIVESQYNLVNVIVRDSVFYVRNFPPTVKLLHKGPKPTDLVLFTSWGPSGKDKRMVYDSILQLWSTLHPSIKTVLFSSNRKVKQHAEKYGCPAHPEYSNPDCKGPPLLGRMFTDDIYMYTATFYAFSNADIAYGEGLSQTLKAIMKNKTLVDSPLLIVGKRTYFNFGNYRKPITTPEEVKCLVSTGDEIHWSSDYFITTKNFPWKDIVPLSIGRPLFCRWIIAFALQSRIPVIDASHTIETLHMTMGDGNRSSWQQPGIHCNRDVIQEGAPKVQMLLGRVECTDLETVRNNGGAISIMRRNVTKKECPVIYNPSIRSVWYTF